MSQWVYPEDHLQTAKERDEYAGAMMDVLGKLNEMTRDRDEWKQQHENLLAIYRAQTEELARVRGQTSASGDHT
jgi:hypothetical protein